MSEENKLKKILDLICSWVGCVDNEFSCSIKDSENLYKDEEQVITYINDLFTENKLLREALLEIARIEPSPIFSYSSKDIDKICIIAEQALEGTCD